MSTAPGGTTFCRYTEAKPPPRPRCPSSPRRLEEAFFVDCFLELVGDGLVGDVVQD